MKTKKNFKKIAGAATAAVLATCSIMPMSFINVSADITINNTQEGHRYEAYQIFSGTLSKNSSGKDVLSDINWGSGVTDGDELLAAIEALGGTFNNCTSAAEVAEKLGALNETSPEFKSFVDVVDGYLSTENAKSSTYSSGIYTISTGSDNGYYLVKDQDNSLSTTAHDAYTNYIIQVLGSRTIDVKSGLPTLEKKVWDVNDSTNNLTAAWGTSADHDYNDNVKFQLTGTLPSNYDTYTTYKYVMNDSLSSNLEFNNDVVVTVGGNTVDASNYSVSLSENNITVTFTNLKNVILTYSEKESVVVEYSAKLKDTADIGLNGESNTASLTYSNNPYDSSKTGKTPDSTVKVYTYEIIVNKVDDSNTALTGAKFELQKYNRSDFVKVGEYTADNLSIFNFKGIDDGRYKLIETAPPTGYNSIDPIYFNVTANHNDSETGLNVSLADKDGANISGGTFTVDANTGIISTDVINKAGSTLPSTGGIGTTPFYVGGGVLVAAAGVYIIVRKRMKNNDNENK